MQPSIQTPHLSATLLVRTSPSPDLDQGYKASASSALPLSPRLHLFRRGVRRHCLNFPTGFNCSSLK